MHVKRYKKQGLSLSELTPLGHILLVLMTKKHYLSPTSKLSARAAHKFGRVADVKDLSHNWIIFEILKRIWNFLEGFLIKRFFLHILRFLERSCIFHPLTTSSFFNFFTSLPKGSPEKFQQFQKLIFILWAELPQCTVCTVTSVYFIPNMC